MSSLQQPVEEEVLSPLKRYWKKLLEEQAALAALNPPVAQVALPVAQVAQVPQVVLPGGLVLMKTPPNHQQYMQGPRPTPRPILIIPEPDPDFLLGLDLEEALDKVGEKISGAMREFVQREANVPVSQNDYDEQIDLKVVRIWASKASFFMEDMTKSQAAISWALALRNAVGHHNLEWTRKYYQHFLSSIIVLFGPKMINCPAVITAANEALNKQDVTFTLEFVTLPSPKI